MPKDPTALDKTHGFDTLMHHTRQNLSMPERVLSKRIHMPVIERISDLAGKTIARPSAAIGASVLTLVGFLIVYLMGLTSGFQLSGSEVPILLVAGSLASLFIEWVAKALRSLFKTRS